VNNCSYFYVPYQRGTLRSLRSRKCIIIHDFRCRNLKIKVDHYSIGTSRDYFYAQLQSSRTNVPRNCGLFLCIVVLWYFPKRNETYQEKPQSGYPVLGPKFEHGTFLVHTPRARCSTHYWVTPV